MRVRNSLTVGVFTIFTAAMILIGANVMAADSAVDVQINGNQLTWSHTMQFGQAVLTVGLPDGTVVKRSFEPSDSLVFSINGAAKGLAQDGSYTWELTFSPADEILVRGEASEKSARTLRNSDMVHSGHFRVLNGSLVTSEAVAEKPFAAPAEAAVVDDSDVPNATKDQVFLDDLIVNGSLCVGLDCVNGESFGFDTLRLKENNLRIRAYDTSTSASFPTRDWQITFNDSSNGGANKFSIDDIDGGRTPFTIEAGAPSHSLYVDDGGRVGFGTSTPVVDLHVKSGNTPTLRLEQDGSSGFTPQTWDVAGNEANFFIRDATNGSTLPFRIFPGAPTNALTIEASGQVGLGTTDPASDLDIRSGTPGMRFTNTGTAGGGYRFQMNGTTGALNWRDLSTDNDVVKIATGANAGLLRIGIDSTGTDATDTVSIGNTSTEATLEIRGSVEVDGVTEHADFVFDSDYQLDSISEHAAFMWREKHLPALPKAPEGLKGPVNLVSHQMGILEELEKAHIYIEQLNNIILDLQSRLEALEEK